MNVFVFDIETIPDLENCRKLFNLANLKESEVIEAVLAKRRQETSGFEFLPLHLQKIVAISAVFHAKDKLKVWSLGTPLSSEKELIERFFDGLKKYTPTLVSWNGSGFDFPVLHYRSMLHGVTAKRYWETGDLDQNFKWNNYINRYHYRHLDLMDILASYQARAYAPLDQIAAMLGFPGKMGMDGSKVFQQYQEGNIDTIRNYCETDVLNTFLVYLRFELMRGKITTTEYDHECQRVRSLLHEENKPHLLEFANAWLG